MSEYPSDEGTPIPFVKFYGDLVVAPAPSRQGDQLWGSLCYGGAVIHQEHVDFPEIGPNGSTWKHAFKFDGRHVMIDGDWMLAASVTNAGTIGEVQDDGRVDFTVSPRE